MGLRKSLLAALLSFTVGLLAFGAGAQAGPAYEKSGKYEDYPTFEGKIVTIDPDAGRLSLRGDGGFRTFSASPRALTALEKGTPVRVIYTREGSGNRAIRIVPLVIPDGVTPVDEIPAEKEKLIERDVLQEIENARRR